jgi:hypothetical protein
LEKRPSLLEGQLVSVSIILLKLRPLPDQGAAILLLGLPQRRTVAAGAFCSALSPFGHAPKWQRIKLSRSAMIGSGEPLMRRQPRLPPLCPLELVLMGLTALMLVSASVLVSHLL